MDFKTYKKKLEELFTKIKDISEEGNIPEMALIKEFTKMATRLQNYAPEEWSYEAEDFAHLAKQLISAAKGEDFQEIYRLISSLDDAKNYCHKSFAE